MLVVVLSSLHIIYVLNVTVLLRVDGRQKVKKHLERSQICRDALIMVVYNTSCFMAYKWENLNDQLIFSRTLYIQVCQLYIMLFASSLALKRAIFPTVACARRCVSGITNKGTNILDSRYDDVVITFARRTAVGRAKKGQFHDTPVDELLYALFKV